MDKAGYVSLIENLYKADTSGLLKAELIRLAGEHPEDHLLNFLEGVPGTEHESVWKTRIVDRALPLAQRAAALVLGMEPCAHGVSGLHPIIAYSWEETFIHLIPWDQLDPELHDLAYYVLITSWQPREVSVSAQRSPGTGKACVKGEYRSVIPAILWAVKRWKGTPQVDRLAGLFDRLPFHHHSSRDISPITEFGDMLIILADDPDLTGQFIDSCVRTVTALVEACDGKSKEEAWSAGFFLEAIWIGLPAELVRLGKEGLAKLLNGRCWQLGLLWHRPAHFTFMDDSVPSPGLLPLLGLLKELMDEPLPDQSDMHIRRFLKGLCDEQSVCGLAFSIDSTLVRALELYAYWHKDGNKESDLSMFLDVSSPLARKGFDMLVSQQGLLRDGNRWTQPATPYLAELLRTVTS